MAYARLLINFTTHFMEIYSIKFLRICFYTVVGPVTGVKSVLFTWARYQVTKNRVSEGTVCMKHTQRRYNQAVREA